MTKKVSDFSWGRPHAWGVQRVPDFPRHRLAKRAPLCGTFVHNPTQVGPVLASDRPLVLEIRIGPNLSPLPPHTRLGQAAQFASALLHDPDRGQVILDTARHDPTFVAPRRAVAVVVSPDIIAPLLEHTAEQDVLAADDLTYRHCSEEQQRRICTLPAS